MKQIIFALTLILIVTSAKAQEVTLSEAKDLVFSDKNGREFVEDKDGQPFKGAVIIPDEEDREITYFYRQGRRHGVAISHYEDGKTELEITYHKGYKNGEEIAFYENGNPQYKKTYKNDVLHGEQIIFYENGKPKQRSIYENGQLNGEVSYFDQQGNLTKLETYKNDIKDGIERIIANNFLIEENHYVDGQLSGITKKYNEKHQTEEITYVDGVANGLHKIFHEDGSRMEIPYVNGKKSGIVIVYYPSGAIAEKQRYANDVKNGLTEKFYENGIRSLATNFKNDQREGISRMFDQNGDLISVSYYIDNMEMAKNLISESATLKDIYAMYKDKKLSGATNKKILWYPVLWLGLNLENNDIIEELNKEMKMYAADIGSIEPYKQAGIAQYVKNNRTLFFGLSPLSYAVNLSLPTEIMQKLTANAKNINETDERGFTALTEAIRLNNAEMIKYLLMKNADVNKIYADGNTALLYAVKENADMEIIDMLLEAGADVNLSDGKHDSTLTYVLRNKVDPQLLARIFNENIDTENNIGEEQKPLWKQLYEQNNLELLKTVLTKRGNITQPDVNGEIPLYTLISDLKNTAMVDLAFSLIDKADNTLWQTAIKSRDLSLVQRTLTKNADINAKDQNGDTALLYAVKNGYDLDFIKKLEESGADVGIKDADGNTALGMAIKADNLALTENLLQNGADINGQYNGRIYLLTLSPQQADMTKLLLQYKAENAYPEKNNIPLLLKAVENNNLTLAEYLLQQNNGTAYQDSEGNNALLWLADWAAENAAGEPKFLLEQISKTTSLFLKYGMDINVRNNNGETLLIRLAKQPKISGYDDIVSALQLLGANPDLRDQYGKTAADYHSK
jgi:antitoxin component YwqK of YwqJK toxin-antitoxin module/ankyrin repeat protein